MSCLRQTIRFIAGIVATFTAVAGWLAFRKRGEE